MLLSLRQLCFSRIFVGGDDNFAGMQQKCGQNTFVTRLLSPRVACHIYSQSTKGKSPRAIITPRVIFFFGFQKKHRGLQQTISRKMLKTFESVHMVN